MSMLALFGIGCAILGIGGTSVTVQAGREALALHRSWPSADSRIVLAMLAFMLLVDGAVVAVGLGLAALFR